MVSYNGEGRLVFEVQAPEAEKVELVGAFHGWHEQCYPMVREDDGRWTISIDAGPGQYLFRYLIDGERWVLDEDAHGTVRTADGSEKSRAWRPPLRLDPDSLAA
jgi:1,4-alpha-glucan branching enzyme